MEIIWGSLGDRTGKSFCFVLGYFGDRFRDHVGIVSASFGYRCGFVSGSYRDRFGIVLGSCWDHFAPACFQQASCHIAEKFDLFGVLVL